MQTVELKIAPKDWIYITIIGAFFGFFISLCFYFISYDLQNVSTIIFSTATAVFISLFAFFLITVSNKFILPKVNQKFWYLISFVFSFLSGFLGFSFSFLLFSFTDFKILHIISPFWIYISVTIGFLTFLVGLILHQFISMKYKNESIKNQILETKLNGAKAAFIFALITIVLAIRASGNKFKISFIKGVILLSIATFFAIIGLYINLVNNNMESSGDEQHIKGVPIVAEKFIHRILANGNQSYMSLPNDVIEQIKTDNILIRLLTPIIGTSQMSRIVGYPANDLGVGRQIILYYTDMDVAGGPTSHFDLFSYVYFGLGGIIFVIFLGYILGSINKLLTISYQKSIFYIALIATLWIRSMAVILEPAVGLAYIFDVIIIFFFLHIFVFMLSKVQNRSNLKCIT